MPRKNFHSEMSLEFSPGAARISLRFPVGETMGADTPIRSERPRGV